MTNDHDTIDGLNDLAVAASDRALSAVARPQRKTRRAPSRRMLTAGGIVLRAFSVLLVIFGFWPFLWTILEAVLLARGEIKNEAHLYTDAGFFAFRLRGWPAILFGLTWSGLTWCVAVVVSAVGHGLYALRDLIESRRS